MFNPRELVKELQEMRDGGFLSDALLRHAVKAIHSSDSRYDWVGVYLLNDEGDELWLHNYVGSPTEHSRIPVGEGICGLAVAEKANQNIPDVSENEHYIACDPDVESELVVLIRAGDQIFGQLDLDSQEAAAFTDEDEAAIQAVSDKLAEQLMAERR
ncbi:MAG: GAF domain-containing protein [Gemmatimonadales bacterium]|nr:MAG: GAF domain-containing protein [Gemmatimonadales bacterium]